MSDNAVAPRLIALAAIAREEIANEPPARCVICGKEKWEHSGVLYFCPIYATYRAPSIEP
jgi:hypothetical protein